jgi:hypothetical protein
MHGMKGIKQIIALGSVGLVSAALAIALVQPATGAAGDPKVWGVGTTKSIDDFTFGSFHTVLKKQVSTPGGYLSINSMIGIEDDCTDVEPSEAQVRLRVDGKNVWKSPYAFEVSTDCDTATNSGVVGAPAVVQVGSGQHTVELQLLESTGATNGLYVEARSLTILYVADGAATPIPWPGDPMTVAPSRQNG